MANREGDSKCLRKTHNILFKALVKQLKKQKVKNDKTSVRVSTIC
mgnify:CR=1 FL=1